MEKYFRHENGITVSEFQMLIIYLNKYCDYQVALRIVRDELNAFKENRYWLVSRDKAWEYFFINFRKKLDALSIINMDELMERIKSKYEKKE